MVVVSCLHNFCGWNRVYKIYEWFIMNFYFFYNTSAINSSKVVLKSCMKNISIKYHFFYENKLLIMSFNLNMLPLMINWQISLLSHFLEKTFESICKRLRVVASYIHASAQEEHLIFLFNIPHPFCNWCQRWRNWWYILFQFHGFQFFLQILLH